MATLHGIPFNVNDTSNPSFIAIQPSQAGRRVKLRMLGISVSPTTTDNITFYFGSRAIWGPIYCDGITNGTWTFQELKYQGDFGENLTVTKGNSGTLVTAYGVYDEE